MFGAGRGVHRAAQSSAVVVVSGKGGVAVVDIRREVAVKEEGVVLRSACLLDGERR